jgi:26S proteasome regulatory subunit N10
MVLESVMICLDNSEWMRNGDYAPTRLEAQQDAAGMICNDRTGSNPENTVGVLTMAGRGVDLLVSPTEDAGKILACFTRVATGGKTDFSSSVQIAQLALKHRKNKNGSQRIIVFVGSPLQEEIPALQKIGKQLKKNNVAVDVISFGELDDNSEKLNEFINSTNSNDNW